MNLNKLLCCIPLLLSACSQNTTPKPLPNLEICLDSLAEGDIVLRRGKDEISNLFAKLSTHNQQYSHCAIAIKHNNKILLYHIMAQNAKNGFRKETIAQFTKPNSNSAFAILRLELDSTQRANFCRQIVYLSTQNIVFDNEFDLVTDKKMYCTEMIYKAIITSTGDTSFIPKTHTVTGKPYIALDNLFEHKNAKIICEVAY